MVDGGHLGVDHPRTAREMEGTIIAAALSLSAAAAGPAAPAAPIRTDSQT